MKKTKMTIILLFLVFSATSVLSQPVTLVTVGDSLTAGDGDDGSGGGYPARLLTMLQAEYPGSTLSNRAVSGNTTTDLINIQLGDAVADLNAAPSGNRKVGVVWIGSNDLFGLYASDVCTEYYPDLETCEEIEMGYAYDNVDTILGALAATGADVYIALLDDQTKRPVIADPDLRHETFPDITDAEVPRMASEIVDYNDQVVTQAATHGAATVDFYNTTIFENEATLSDDGNHPNGAGYDAIALIWYRAIISSAADAPEMEVRGNGVEIVDGDATPSVADHTDFGNADVTAGQKTRTFVVHNTGTGDLHLTGNPRVALGGEHYEDFSVEAQPSSSVSPNGWASFKIMFDPAETGARRAQVSIANDDSDETPYTFEIQGTGLEYNIWQGSSDDWNNAENWSDGKIPDQTVHVLIPASFAGAFPVINSSPVAKAAGFVASGGSLTVKSSRLEIGGR